MTELARYGAPPRAQRAGASQEIAAGGGPRLLGGSQFIEDRLLGQRVLVEDEAELHVRLDLGVRGQELLLPQVADVDVAADVQVDVALGDRGRRGLRRLSGGGGGGRRPG